MFNLLLKSLIGALLVIFISVIAKTKNYYLAGLAPLFPAFAIIAHYTLYKEKTIVELKATIFFGIFALIPYFAYLLSLYFLIDLFDVKYAILLSSFIWLIFAIILVSVWSMVR